MKIKTSHIVLGGLALWLLFYSGKERKTLPPKPPVRPSRPPGTTSSVDPAPVLEAVGNPLNIEI